MSGVTLFVGMASPPVGGCVSAGSIISVFTGFSKVSSFFTPPVGGVVVSGSVSLLGVGMVADVFVIDFCGGSMSVCCCDESMESFIS